MPKNAWKRKKVTERELITAGGEKLTERDPWKYRHYLYPRDDVNFTLFTHPECPYCLAALEALVHSTTKDGKFLKFRNFDYVVCFLDPQLAKDINELSNNHKTIPLVFEGVHFVGGFRELIKLLRKKYKMEWEPPKIKGDLEEHKALLKDAWNELKARTETD